MKYLLCVAGTDSTDPPYLQHVATCVFVLDVELVSSAITFNRDQKLCGGWSCLPELLTRHMFA